MNEEENTPKKYGDKEYTTYEALQRQRKLETKMRAQRQEIHLLKTGNASEDDILNAQSRYRVTSAEYTRFSKEMGLPQQRERVTVDGLGKIGANNGFVSGKTVANSGESGIIKVDIDELTPCLRRLKDNKIVRTEVFEIKPKKSDFADWEFDWLLPAKSGHSVYAIKAKEDERIQGLVALKLDERNCAVHIDIVEAAPFNNPHNKKFVQKEYSGVGGHLFAEAVRQSYEAGFDGAVYFTAKSDLIEHYKKELGAVLTNPRLRIMFIDEEAAIKLYNRYYKGV